MLQRPEQTEYPAYFVPYIQRVPDQDLLTTLNDGLKKTVDLFESIPEVDANFRYATDKWSIKEVLGHMTDTERVMSYRLLRIGRGDRTPLAGFNENDFIKNSQFNSLPLKVIIEDFVAVRNATLTLISNISESAWENKGIANDIETTARAIAYIIAGHEIHHRNIIADRYLTLITK